MTTVQNQRSIVGPLSGLFAAFPVALFPAALLADIAYLNTAEIQWTNFASWLIAGANLFTGVLLVWASVGLFRGISRRRVASVVLVAVLFVLGVVNSLQHAKDGWHSVGSLGLTLSILCTVLALVLAFVTYSPTPMREAR